MKKFLGALSIVLIFCLHACTYMTQQVEAGIEKCEVPDKAQCVVQYKYFHSWSGGGEAKNGKVFVECKKLREFFENKSCYFQKEKRYLKKYPR